MPPPPVALAIRATGAIVSADESRFALASALSRGVLDDAVDRGVGRAATEPRPRVAGAGAGRGYKHMPCLANPSSRGHLGRVYGHSQSW